MAVSQVELTLVVPGLLGSHAPTADARPALAATALEALLSRGRMATASVVGPDPTLFSLFGLTPDVSGGWPIAPVCARGDGLAPGADYWFRMDPIGLQPDRDRLVLLPAESLAITPAEAQALIAQLRTTLDLDCHAPVAQRWYLQGREPLALRTHPLHDVIARPVDRFLPEGPDAGRWQALATEIEMVLHAHPVNQARAAADRPMINGVWLWGGGQMPATIAAPWGRVYDDDAVGRGLALSAAIPVVGVPSGAAALLADVAPNARVLAVLHDAQAGVLHGEAGHWARAVTDLDQRWFEPAHRALESGALARLELWPGDGRRWRITRADLRRFWRPRRSIWGYVAEQGGS